MSEKKNESQNDIVIVLERIENLIKKLIDQIEYYHTDTYVSLSRMQVNFDVMQSLIGDIADFVVGDLLEDRGHCANEDQERLKNICERNEKRRFLLWDKIYEFRKEYHERIRDFIKEIKERDFLY